MNRDRYINTRGSSRCVLKFFARCEKYVTLNLLCNVAGNCQRMLQISYSSFVMFVRGVLEGMLMVFIGAERRDKKNLLMLSVNKTRKKDKTRSIVTVFSLGSACVVKREEQSNSIF